MDAIRRIRLFRLLQFAVVAAFVAGCNIFNPSGSGATGELSIDAKMIEAENMLRKEENGKAARLFGEVLASDSSRSKAYFGLAKATMRIYEIEPKILLEFLDLFNDQEDPLAAAINLATTLHHRVINGMIATKEILEPLITRDSLQLIWEKEKRTVSPYNSSHYPLSDRVISGRRISIDYQILLAAETFVWMNRLKEEIFDAQRTDFLDCIPFVDEGCEFDPERLLEQAKNDTTLQKNLVEELTILTENIDQLTELTTGMLDLNTSGLLSEEMSTQVSDELIQIRLNETDSLLTDYLDQLTSFGF